MFKITKKELGIIKKLKHKKYRMAYGCFVVEGRRAVLDFLSEGHGIRWLLGTPAFIKSHAPLLKGYSKVIFEVTEDVLAGLGSLKTNKEVLMVGCFSLADKVVCKQRDQILVLDHISDPGNLGTMLRIADWYGLRCVVASRETVDCYHPKVVQASMGSLARVEVHYTNLPIWLKQAREQGLEVIGGVLDGGDILHGKWLPKGGCLVIGSEAHGISDEVMGLLTCKVTIPRYGGAASLNAAVASAVICDRWLGG